MNGLSECQIDLLKQGGPAVIGMSCLQFQKQLRLVIDGALGLSEYSRSPPE
jgi:hypothetical protein